MMTSIWKILICFFIGFINSKEVYTIIDNEEAIKAYVPQLLNMTDTYLSEYPDLPDVVDDERWQQHLGLVHNKFLNVIANTSVDCVRKITFYPENSSFVIDLQYPLSYEITSDFIYNFLIIPVTGKSRIKGHAIDMQINMKILPIPNNQICAPKNQQYVIDALTVKTTFITTEVHLSPENVFTDMFDIKGFISKVFSSNTGVLVPSVRNATINATEEYFADYFLRPIAWDYSAMNGKYKWKIKTDFCKVIMTPYNSFETIYNQTEIMVDSQIPTKITDSNYEVRKLMINKQLVEDALNFIHTHVNLLIKDTDLPKEFINRLDIRTFQKYVPDSALRSINQYGEENNTIELLVAPNGNLEYFLENKDKEYAIAEYIFNFTNHGDPLIHGTVGVLYEIIPIWIKATQNKVAYFNIKLNSVKIVGQNIHVERSEFFETRFKDFFNEIAQKIILSKFDSKPNIFDRGIPLEDTDAAYKSTEIYWDQDFSEIIISHFNY